MKAVLLTVLLAVPLVAQGQYDETDIRLRQQELELNSQFYWMQSLQAQQEQARALNRMNHRMQRQAAREAAAADSPGIRGKFGNDDPETVVPFCDEYTGHSLCAGQDAWDGMEW